MSAKRSIVILPPVLPMPAIAVSGGSAQAPSGPGGRDERLQRLEFLVGDWRQEAELTAAAPGGAGQATGTSRNAWLVGSG